MPFESLKEKAENIQDNLKNAIDSSIEYYKLWLFKVFMKSTTMVVRVLLMLVFFLFFMFFASIGLALYLGKLMDNTVLGFLAVSSIYLLLVLVAYLIKDKIVEGTMLQRFSKIFFNE
ncbi:MULTISPECIES: competence protein [Flavobacterium]|uniref:competence protein n=1 Tax=Flavobacterium TaxID=237 RepID=UPI001FCBC213|nr:MULTISPECIES: competence protein [Flavobacterium]UOK43134.1 competence protein [Flavobacterium enshiense]